MKNLLFGFIAIFTFCSFTPDKSDLNKAERALSETLALNEIDLRPADKYYMLISDSKIIGKVYFRRVRPKAETFTYFVAFDNNGVIIKLQITDYPSSHGAKINDRRWSEKFSGKRPGADNFGNDVDAVSGGTLSIRSLINDLKSIASEN